MTSLTFVKFNRVLFPIFFVDDFSLLLFLFIHVHVLMEKKKDTNRRIMFMDAFF